MNSLLPDDIDELKRLLAEQEALNRALLEKLNEREREIDHLQAQLDKLRRMNFGSRCKKSPAVSRRWKPTLSSCRRKRPLPAGWMTRPCSSAAADPYPQTVP
jgi:transposase